MPGTPKELDLEKYIVDYLTSQPIITIAGEALVDRNGEQMYEYRQVETADYDRDLCLIRSEVVAFLKDTQPEEYKKLVDAKGGSEAEAEKALFSRLDTELSRYGTLSVLKDRNGLSAPGANFKMMYTKPVSSKNAEHEGLYHLKNL